MSEYLQVEKPSSTSLALSWTVVDQGHGIIPQDPAASFGVVNQRFRNQCIWDGQTSDFIVVLIRGRLQSIFALCFSSCFAVRSCII